MSINLPGGGPNWARNGGGGKLYPTGGRANVGGGSLGICDWLFSLGGAPYGGTDGGTGPIDPPALCKSCWFYWDIWNIGQLLYFNTLTTYW